MSQLQQEWRDGVSRLQRKQVMGAEFAAELDILSGGRLAVGRRGFRGIGVGVQRSREAVRAPDSVDNLDQVDGSYFTF